MAAWAWCSSALQRSEGCSATAGPPRAQAGQRPRNRAPGIAGTIGPFESSDFEHSAVLAPGAERRFGTSTCTTVRSLTDLAAFSPVLLSAGGISPPGGGTYPWVGRPCLRRHTSTVPALGRRWAGGAQGGGGGGGGESFSPRIPPWHAYLARFSRVRAAMRTAPGARKVGPDDTGVGGDEVRDAPG
eukprot:gene20891-biopygen13150